MNRPALLAGLREHSQRRVLDRELHARPSEEVHSPLRASHLAVLSGPGGTLADCRQVAELCRRYNAPEPTDDAPFWFADLGAIRLRWERHNEFSTFTFSRTETQPDDPFVAPPIALVPTDWLQSLSGDVLVATHVIIETSDKGPPNAQETERLFGTSNLAGSRVLDGTACVWSDFRIHNDGFDRLLIHDYGLTPRQAGRLVQHLLEIESYRSLAMLGFIPARKLASQLDKWEKQLASLIGRMDAVADKEMNTSNESHQAEEIIDETALLSELTQLAAVVENSVASHTYRFAASRAYYALVTKRIGEIREQRLEGLQTLEGFMERRLAPAMRTIEAMSEWQGQLSQRIARASALLQTRVDVSMQQQSQALLASMNRRADLQLRLQETVEGLSVVVLSYYLVGLVGYGAKALSKLGVPLNPDVVTGIAIPLVVALLAWRIHLFKKQLDHH